jgi:hypothetical protein
MLFPGQLSKLMRCWADHSLGLSPRSDRVLSRDKDAARPSPEKGSRPIRVTPASAPPWCAHRSYPPVPPAGRSIALRGMTFASSEGLDSTDRRAEDGGLTGLATFSARARPIATGRLFCPGRPSPPEMCDDVAGEALEATRLRRVLHCVPVPGATQSVAWDASGL